MAELRLIHTADAIQPHISASTPPPGCSPSRIRAPGTSNAPT
jgi:hypothetical protein